LNAPKSSLLRSMWRVGFRCIYLRDDDFGAFMCEG